MGSLACDEGEAAPTGASASSSSSGRRDTLEPSLRSRFKNMQKIGEGTLPVYTVLGTVSSGTAPPARPPTWLPVNYLGAAAGRRPPHGPLAPTPTVGRRAGGVQPSTAEKNVSLTTSTVQLRREEPPLPSANSEPGAAKPGGRERAAIGAAAAACVAPS